MQTLAWALIAVSVGGYNTGTVTKINDYESESDCEKVVQVNARTIPYGVELHCIKLITQTHEIHASEIVSGDLITLPDGRNGKAVVKNYSNKEGHLIVEIHKKGSFMQRVYLPKESLVTVTR